MADTAQVIGQVGVIGAGEMGHGIAHVCALGGHPVLITDSSREVLARASDRIRHNLDRQVAAGRIDAAARDAALRRVTTVPTLKGLADCDLVIEAVIEDEAVKRQVDKELCAHLKPDGLLATNTSSISITRLGAATDRPGQFMGVHFMKPAPVMQLVELIRGIATTDDTFDRVARLIRDLGKTAAVSEDFPAFIVNRILLPMLNEAIYALYEGVGSVEAIDTAMKLGANHPMGPLELADFIG
ncbi:MAG: 3-hydroxyacyl-CoA dehydrogenase NAD-binding domain-containing protein, partial [Alphaproteobacteria bacterium]